MSAWETIIGLEVHVQLDTATKLFCRCAYEYGGQPNTQTCPVCLALPGALPVLNREALRLGIRTALAVGADVATHTKFDRKNYFYPDLPKGYQISQFDEPFCSGGAITIEFKDGSTKRIGITRIHLEEDAGKSTHRDTGGSVVDLNRCGVPLLEIVSEPDMRSPEEAYRYLTALKLTLRYIGVSDCDMEKGSLRCDANVSVRPRGQEAFGTKVEIKNLNSFRNVQRALEFEVARHTAALEHGSEEIVQQTRLFDATTGETRPMRSKEQAHDYRYFPEPDVPPVTIAGDEVEAIGATLPELPRAKVDRLATAHGLPRYDGWVLAEEPSVADYFEEAVAADAANDPKAVSNWVTNEVKRVLNEGTHTIDAFPIPSGALSGLIAMQRDGAVSATQAKEVFQGMLETGDDAPTVAKARGLEQLSDTDALETAVRAAIDACPKAVADVRAGKEKAKGAIVGHVMKQTRGKANPGVVQQLIDRVLAE